MRQGGARSKHVMFLVTTGKIGNIFDIWQNLPLRSPKSSEYLFGCTIRAGKTTRFVDNAFNFCPGFFFSFNNILTMLIKTTVQSFCIGSNCDSEVLRIRYFQTPGCHNSKYRE